MAIKYHLLNIVKIRQPRWHDRVVLPRLDKFKAGYNIITIDHSNYAGKYIIHSNKLLPYPTEEKFDRWGNTYQVKVIPLTDLRTIQEFEAERHEIYQTAMTIFDD